MNIRAALRTHRYLFGLVGVVVIVYAALYAHILRNFPDIGSTNDTQYSSISVHLAREGVYSTGRRDAAGNLIPTASQPPLYTLLYAASYKAFGIGAAANEPMRILLMLANIGIIVVTWHIGRFFSAYAANIAATFAALDLTAFYFAQNYDIPDTLVGFFLALWLFYFLKFLRGAPPYRAIVLSTVFLGLAMLTKIGPFLLWVPLAAFLAAFLWRSPRTPLVVKLRTFGVFAIVITLFFCGWTLRNVVVTGSSVFASGATSLQWNTSHLLAYQQGIPLVEARKQIAERYFPDTLVARGEDAVEREGGRALVGLVLDSPFDFGVVVLRAMPGFFFGTFPPYMLFNRATADALKQAVIEGHGHRALLQQLWSDGRVGYVLLYVISKLHLLLLYGTGAVAVVVFLRRRELRWTLALFAVTVAYVLAVSGAAAQARYRMMIFPIVYVLGGCGVAYLWERLRERRTPSIVP